MSEDPTKKYRFGRFELSELAETLRYDGVAIPVGATAFDLLKHLVQHHGRLVSKTELKRLIWGDDDLAYDANLHGFVSQLRNALDMAPDGRDYLRNVRGKGYVFEAPGLREIEEGADEHASGAGDGARDENRPPQNAIPDEALIALLNSADTVARKAFGVLIQRYSASFRQIASAYDEPETLTSLAFLAIVQESRQYDPFLVKPLPWLHDRLESVLGEQGRFLTTPSAVLQRAALPDETAVVLRESFVSLDAADREAIAVRGAGDRGAMGRLQGAVLHAGVGAGPSGSARGDGR